MLHRFIAAAVVLCSIFAPPCHASVESDERIEDVVRRHMSTVALLRELSLKVSTKYRFQGERDFTQGISYVWHWSRVHDKTRLLSDTNVTSPDGWAVNKMDTLFDRKKKVSMGIRGWDPHRPPPRPLTLKDPGRVAAGIDESYVPGHFLSDSGMVGRVLHFVFTPPIHAEITTPRIPYVLDEFVRVARRVDYAEVLDENQSLIRLRLHWDPLIDTYSDLFIDPAAGYLVRNVAEPMNLSTIPASSKLSRVTEFQVLDDGVVFPVKVEIKMYSHPPHEAKTLGMEGVAVVDELNVNRSLPEDAFDFRFPENARVDIGPPKDGKTKLMLWGPNNQPLRQIRGVKDFEALARAEALAPRRRLWGAIAVAVAAAAILAGVSIWIRRRRTA